MNRRQILSSLRTTYTERIDRNQILTFTLDPFWIASFPDGGRRGKEEEGYDDDDGDEEGAGVSLSVLLVKASTLAIAGSFASIEIASLSFLSLLSVF